MLDIYSPIPLHVQLKNLLETEIRTGSYTEKIPSERELMDRFSVSRFTVREAVSALVQEGVLEKKHGRGTFITLKPVQEWLGQLSSYEETVKSMGMKPSSRSIFHGQTSSPENVSQILDLDKFYLIKRLRFADDKPVAIKEHYYPLEIGLELAKSDLDTAVLYDLLELSLGLNLSEAEQIITSGIPSKEEAQYLDIPPSSSVLIREQLIFDPDGNPIEYSRSVFRTDMYAFHMKMARKRR
ncbi:GntR family transcriptional regulator [Ferviditalea candida]|uniref:GntR family transcriptional regulator n=1 Tax=Ferviditalea candida TaxID=3108399 RepID=A0ABU5ZEQ0_9BACL|nr:GntR family transcriptional regulator [Paenibacillaceae bacterium T2]